MDRHTAACKRIQLRGSPLSPGWEQLWPLQIAQRTAGIFLKDSNPEIHPGPSRSKTGSQAPECTTTTCGKLQSQPRLNQTQPSLPAPLPIVCNKLLITQQCPRVSWRKQTWGGPGLLRSDKPPRPVSTRVSPKSHLGPANRLPKHDPASSLCQWSL